MAESVSSWTRLRTDAGSLPAPIAYLAGTGLYVADFVVPGLVKNYTADWLFYFSSIVVHYWPGGGIMKSQSLGQPPQAALEFVRSCGLHGKVAEDLARFLDEAVRTAYEESRTAAELRKRLVDVRTQVRRMAAHR